MKSQREKIILNYFAPNRTLDVVDMYSWLSPDITISEPEMLPWGGRYKGLTGVGEYLTKVTQSILSEIQLEEVYSCGDKVVAIGRSNGKVRKNGRPFNIRVTQLFTFNPDNKISQVEFLADLPSFLEVLEEKLPAP
ncbi:MAG: nuclear transport factor 2 family protein [Lewinellaceae bacterium]|nr:nuclear transport factor 2 family protein [Saprospiraceae bacterium]MCB9337533.1 nuclear transport factor 2 family protein [Lewinellaceae bacterium]